METKGSSTISSGAPEETESLSSLMVIVAQEKKKDAVNGRFVFGSRIQANQILQNRRMRSASRNESNYSESNGSGARRKDCSCLRSGDRCASQELIESNAISKGQFNIKPKGLISEPKRIGASRRDRVGSNIVASAFRACGLINCSNAARHSSTDLNEEQRETFRKSFFKRIYSS